MRSAGKLRHTGKRSFPAAALSPGTAIFRWHVRNLFLKHWKHLNASASRCRFLLMMPSKSVSAVMGLSRVPIPACARAASRAQRLAIPPLKGRDYDHTGYMKNAVSILTGGNGIPTASPRASAQELPKLMESDAPGMTAIHTDYLRAGHRILTTNTFDCKCAEIS